MPCEGTPLCGSQGRLQRRKIARQGDTTDGSCRTGISWEQTGINVQYGNIVGYDGIYVYIYISRCDTWVSQKVAWIPPNENFDRNGDNLFELRIPYFQTNPYVLCAIHFGWRRILNHLEGKRRLPAKWH